MKGLLTCISLLIIHSRLCGVYFRLSLSDIIINSRPPNTTSFGTGEKTAVLEKAVKGFILYIYTYLIPSSAELPVFRTYIIYDVNIT